MSTDLYGVRVLGVHGKLAKLRVFLVYYDWEHLPTERTFFLRALWDTADTRFGGGGPLGDAVDVKQICDESFVNDHAHRFIAGVRQVKTRNYPLRGRGRYDTFYYERDGSWKDEEILVQGDYEIEATDARWLQHLEPGMSWGTTAYDTPETPRVASAGEVGPLSFAGKTVVLTGRLAMPRPAMEAALMAMGARVAKSVGPAVDLLVVGEKPGSKLQKATALGIAVVDQSVVQAAMQHAADIDGTDPTTAPTEAPTDSGASPPRPRRRSTRPPVVVPPDLTDPTDPTEPTEPRAVIPPRTTALRAPTLRELPLASRAQQALLGAALQLRLREVEQILAGGTDPNFADPSGIPLLSAVLLLDCSKKDNATKGRIVSALLGAGADPNVACPSHVGYGAVPVFVAVTRFETKRLLPVLAEHGASLAAIEPRGGRSLLHVAAEDLNRKLLDAALEAGADASGPDREGHTPLHTVACSWRGASRGPLITALVAAGAEVDARTPEGQTPALLAAQHANTATLRAFVKAGADLLAVDAQGRTAAHFAAMGTRKDSLSVVEEVATLNWLLESTTLTLDVVDHHKETLLHAAARSGSLRMVRELLARGLSPEAVNDRGERPRDVCTNTARRALL